jgi:DNA polymerase III epsilon subunit-like protein
VKDKPIFNTFAKIFVNHIENADIVVGHNLAYDIGVIENEFRRIYTII